MRPFQTSLLLMLLLLAACTKEKIILEEVQVFLPVSIYSVSPLAGKKNAQVTILGTGFGHTDSAVQVRFNDKIAQIVSLNDSVIVTKVPSRADNGYIELDVNGKTLTGPYFKFEYTATVSTVRDDVFWAFGLLWGHDNHLYYLSKNKIMKMDENGDTATFAGTGEEGSINADALNSKFRYPRGMVQDSKGNIFVTDVGNDQIRRIGTNGQVSVFAGSNEGFLDGTGINAKFNNPHGLAIDNNDNIYVTDLLNNAVRKITPAGSVTTLAGNLTAGDLDAVGKSAVFNGPTGIAVNKDGIIYVADANNSKIKKILPSGEVFTIAGSGTKGFADGHAAGAQFNAFVNDIKSHPNGDLFICDLNNNRIRLLSPDGHVTTLAGGDAGYSDGIGTEAQFYFTVSMAFVDEYTLYVSEGNHTYIRKIILD